MKKFNLHNNRSDTQVSYITYAAGDRNLGLYKGGLLDISGRREPGFNTERPYVNVRH